MEIQLLQNINYSKRESVFIDKTNVSLEKGKIQFWYLFINRLDPCKSLGTLKEMMIKP